MSLTSPGLLGIVAVLTVLGPVALIVVWGRGPGGIGGRLLRLIGIVVCQLLAVAAVGLYANNQYGFYNDWSDLLGEPNAAAGTLDLTGLVPPDGSQGRIQTITVKVPGGRGLGATRLPVLVWVPKQYDRLENRLRKFPTLMVLPGQPSTAEAMFDGFSFGKQATQAIDSGEVRPFVAVFPPLMIAPPRDTECTDVPGGPQAETWLSKSVRNQVVKSIRSCSGAAACCGTRTHRSG